MLHIMKPFTPYTLRATARAFWERLGAKFITVKPQVQMAHGSDAREGVITLGDAQGRIKEWFGKQNQSIVFVRPDRFVAALCSPQEVSSVTAALARKLAAPLEA